MKLLKKVWFSKWTQTWNITVKLKSPSAQIVEAVARAVQKTLADPSFPYDKQEEEETQTRSIGFHKEEE